MVKAYGLILKPYDTFYHHFLVQDQFGNEVDWRKLQAGDQFPINQAGSLTVTLSSSDKADILDSDNKKIEINSKNSGISIVRLP